MCSAFLFGRRGTADDTSHTLGGNSEFWFGNARSAEQLMNASLQVDLFDPTYPENWKEGFFMREPDKKVLLKSDYLRKEAELFIDYISKGEVVNDNQFMCRTLKEVMKEAFFSITGFTSNRRQCWTTANCLAFWEATTVLRLGT
jgi:hypothetical protein